MSGLRRCQTHSAKLSLGRRTLLQRARQFLCYFRRRTLNCDAVLVVEADLDLARLISVHNGANERGVDEQQPRSECRLKENEHYSTHVSFCPSSATAAWIAAAIVAIRASFAAGLRSKVAPISSANILSAASIASTARSVAVFIGAPLRTSENGCTFHSIGNPKCLLVTPSAPRRFRAPI